MVDPYIAIREFKKKYVPHFSETKINGKRQYVTPSNSVYPSVTTILSSFKNEGLEKWKQAVGEEKAKEICDAAATSGTFFHKLVEKYFEGEEINLTPDSRGVILFKSFRTILPKIEPLALELPLWSDRLKTAGRADCVGFYEGKLSLIDFKTSRKTKKANLIENYFLQATIYSLMLYEQTKIDCKQIVILISTDSGVPQVFKRNRNDFIKKTLEKIKAYYDNER